MYYFDEISTLNDYDWLEKNIKQLFDNLFGSSKRIIEFIR